MFLGFVEQFREQFAQLSALNGPNGRAPKFGAFDRVLRAIYSDFAVALVRDALSAWPGASPAATAAVPAPPPAWLYVCYSPVLSTAMDSGLSPLSGIAAPSDAVGASANPKAVRILPSSPRPSPPAAAASAASLPAKAKHPYRHPKPSAKSSPAAAAAASVASDAEPLTVAGANAFFVRSTDAKANAAFPPDFALLSGES